MPPKKKIVKKIVRKAKSNAQTPPHTSLEPESVPEFSAPANDDAGAAGSSATDTETPVPQATETAAETSAAEENAPSEPASDGTPQPPPATATATETLEKEAESAAMDKITVEQPPAAKPAGGESIVEQPAATVTLAAEIAAGKASEALLGAAKKKTVVRVRKVVRKTIVKKIVPKTAASTKAISNVEDGDPKVEEEKVEASKHDEDQTETVNHSTSDAPSPMETVPEIEDVGKVKDVEITELEEKIVDEVKEVEKGCDLEMEMSGDQHAAISDSSSRKKTEIFIGGLDRDAKEEDLRKVFGEAGEIVEVRMMMDGESGKNKGYAFLRYADASQSKKAVTMFEKVEVCGKICGASALKGNDTIFLGNIDKKWKKEDIIKLLKEFGIEKIEAVTVMPDSSNAELNRGFAFLELETNKDAHFAYKKLQKKDAFGKGRNIKVAWAEPLNDPDEEQMKKVKSVYAEGIPASWNEETVKEVFKKFGEIERIVLACNIKSSKRKDFAFVNYTTREAALSCIESFDKEELTENGSKVNVKISLAKPVQKGNQNKGGSKSSSKDSFKETPKAVQNDTKASIIASKGKSFGGVYTRSTDIRSSTNHELLHVVREQATWQRGHIGYARVQNRAHGIEGKRPFSSLGDKTFYSDTRGHPRARLDNVTPTGSSHGAMLPGISGSSHTYYQHQGGGYAGGAHYGATDYPAAHQMRQGTPPYGNSYYSRY